MRTTRQQDRILIAITRDHLPRTVANLAVETGIPAPSVRRTLSELARVSSPRVRPLVMRALVDRLEGN